MRTGHLRIALHELRRPELYPIEIQPTDAPLRSIPSDSSVVPGLEIKEIAKLDLF